MGAAVRLAVAISILIAPGLLLAASAPVADPLRSLAIAIAQANAEARAAEAQARALSRAAQQASDEAEALRRRQDAAAQAIAAAEASITAADLEARMLAAGLAKQRELLAQQQAPAGALLAGLAMMSRRPPLLTILNEGSTQEFVRVRILLDSTMPVIRSRTAHLRNELAKGRELQHALQEVRADAARNRSLLENRQREFAALEEQAMREARAKGLEALGAGDVALARGEEAGAIERQAERSRTAAEFAAELARSEPPPPRPVRAEGSPAVSPLPYRLPVSAAVTEGLGAVDPSGIRSRGITLAARRGAQVQAPADGIVRFAGPFRSHDGIVIIDHGAGWTTLMINVSSPLAAGQRIGMGQPIGRALGPLGVELSRNGRNVSPALIAGSSQMLSNGGKVG